MMFKKPEQLTDVELRHVITQLAAQIQAVEEVVATLCVIQLARAGNLEPPPDDVRAAMLNILADYTDHVMEATQHLERMYEQIARNN